MKMREVIQNRLNNFWGYGSLEAPTWFIGMEPGLGNANQTEIENCLKISNGHTTIDIRKDIEKVPTHSKFLNGKHPPIQPTLKYPILLHLLLQAEEFSTDEDRKEKIRNYQTSILGSFSKKRMQPWS